jgi:hypothetical protein
MFKYAKNVNANGSNLHTFSIPDDFKRKCDTKPRFYDLTAAAHFIDGKTKTEFTRKEFISVVAAYIGIAKPNYQQSTCIQEASHCFGWWKSHGAIVEVAA